MRIWDDPDRGGLRVPDSSGWCPQSVLRRWVRCSPSKPRVWPGNNRDWHHLVDLCGLTSTLIIDAEGIYDPHHFNDRLLLGLKGTMSEWELGVMRQRSLVALRERPNAESSIRCFPSGS